MKKQALFGAVTGLMFACALPANAQSIDYGSLEQLFNEPVTTSATGSPQRAPEAPADMQIISQEDIRRSGAFDLPTIISRVAGIDMLAFGAGHADINVRGYNQANSPRLLVLINGRQVYLDHYGVTMWSSLPVQLSEIRQIEVVKGPNAALFGFNAVSGVVNIITYNPKFDATNAVQVRGGTGDNLAASAVVSHKFGEAFSARLSLGAERADEWKNTVVDPTLLHDPRSVSAALDTVAQLSEKVELRVEGGWSNAQQSNIAGIQYSPTKIQTTSVKGTLAADTRLGLVQVSAYQNDLSGKYIIIGNTNWENRIRVVSAQDIFKVGAAHTFRVGAEYRNNTLNAAPIDTGDVSYDVFAVSGMWNWAITDKLATTLALRHDTLKLKREGGFAPGAPLTDNALWNRDINEPSVNAAVVWRPTADGTVRASYARGVQAPTLVELSVQGIRQVTPTVGVALIGNPLLKPSIVQNYQLSYDHNLPTLNAKVGARVFLQKWEDLKGLPRTSGFDFLPTATSLPARTFVNTGDSEMKGFELTASGKLAKGFRWSADYTYTDVNDDPVAGLDTAIRSAAFERATPKSRGNLSAGWADKTWEVDGFAHYVSSFEYYPQIAGPMQKVDAYATLGARIGYRLENGATFAVSGQNLLKDRQTQTTGLKAERRLQLSVTKAW